MRIEWDVPIAMDDGVVLRADVFRPIDDGEYPVLMSHGPYGKGVTFQDGYPDAWRTMTQDHPDISAGSTNKYACWEVLDPEKWVPHGYVILRVDSRGAGRSPGVLDLFSPRETRDYYECIEWAAVQPWSNGRIGLSGISYYATNQWQVAALRPPHLVAISPWEGFADHYRNWGYQGGIRCTFVDVWFPPQVEGVQHGVGDRGLTNPNTGELAAGPETLSQEDREQNLVDLPASIRAHPLDGKFYEARSTRSSDWANVDVPMLSCSTWGAAGFCANFESFERAASPQKWLEVHGLEHWTHYYTDYGQGLQHRFFDHFLKREDNGWDTEPPVLLQVRHPGDRFVERKEHEWPLARTRWTKFYLDPENLSLGLESASGSVAYEGFGVGVTFRTGPLAEETEITGPLAARLYVSSETTDADLFVVLRVYAPDGSEVTFMGAADPHTPPAQGWLRASHRTLDPKRSAEWRPFQTHDEIRPLTPGNIYELDVEIWPTCVVVPAGYTLALTVRGKDYEYDGPPIPYRLGEMRGCGAFLHNDPEDRPSDIFGGTVTLHADQERQPYVLLPIIPPAE